MIITKDFVMLNFPKTGSSFTREAIKQIYFDRNSKIRKFLEKNHVCSPSVKELLVPKIDEKINYNIRDQHGTLRQIPIPYRNRLIASVTRSPISRYKSTYYFKWWQQHPPGDIQTIYKGYPHFPELSFSEYYELIHFFGRKNRLQRIVPKIDLGLHTIQFIQFYFYKPQDVLSKIDDKYIEENHFLKDMGDIKFLHQENLRQELKEFLLSVGIEKEYVQTLDIMKKVNVTKRESHIEEVEPEILSAILKREKLLFKIFPEYLPN